VRARVRWSPLAIQRVEEAARFIARDDPTAAVRWVRGLFDSVDLLRRFPRRGRVAVRSPQAEIRELIYREHRVIYRVTPRLVEVLTIRHARRSPDGDEGS
jgi:plasmid stabilization system protein ParE